MARRQRLQKPDLPRPERTKLPSPGPAVSLPRQQRLRNAKGLYKKPPRRTAKHDKRPRLLPFPTQQNDLLAYSSSTLQPGITSQIQGLLQHSRDAAPALAWGQYLYRMLIARLCRRILTEYVEFNFEQESRLADSIHLLHPLTSMTSRLEIGSQLMLTNIPKFLKRTGEWLKRSHLRSLDSQRSRVAHLFTLALHPREESYKEFSRLMLPLGGVSVLQLNHWHGHLHLCSDNCLRPGHMKINHEFHKNSAIGAGRATTGCKMA